MTLDGLAQLIYQGPRTGFDMGWDHPNLGEKTRDAYRRAAERVADALGVALDPEPDPAPDPRYEAVMRVLSPEGHRPGEGWNENTARAIVAALDAADAERRTA